MTATPATPVTAIPAPSSCVTGEGRFTFTSTTRLTADPALARAAEWTRQVLTPATGLRLPEGPGGVEFRLVEGLAPEEYRLTATTRSVLIEASAPPGAFYGAQTLRQLLDPAAYRAARTGERAWSIPEVTIRDAPRYGWRGCLIDVARHFLPKPDLLRYIDLLAAHKLNVLHLHLTDDQGWRLEIRKYPKLTEVGAWRRESPLGARRHRLFDGRPHGGYYTQDDIREVVSYAADRFVTIVPEIDLPGHTQAAIAAYPQLGNLATPLEVRTEWGVGENVLNVSDETIAFFTDVLDEVLELFPGRYVCVGGDETPKTQWNESVPAKERIRELGLRDADELQSWLMRHFTDYLLARGRKPLGWDELLEGGLPPGVTVGAWRGHTCTATAARAGHDVVVSPFAETYLDFRQAEGDQEPVPIGSVTSLEAVHSFDPVPPGLAERDRILGAQAALWTEHIDSPRLLDYMAFPRLAAFAEAMWSDERDFDDFLVRLAVHEKRLDALSVEYRPATGPHPWQRRPDAPGHPRTRAEIDRELAIWTSNLHP
ncbi:beta-N-acetylhexosaminidase [Nonomuraea indica]|uniref:beta-N-acetylhexosaminidase n=1 Tax=Nonomuraea indica TaxID=1581193 RepID=UPI001FEA0B37|nr:beta-N-acetylhexosaminidase [Nonomuraea indica]